MPNSTFQPPASGTIPATAVSAASDEGAQLYGSFCATCHGPDGKSNPDVKNAPSLANPALLSLLDDHLIRRTIEGGRPGENGRDQPGSKMPVFGAANGGPLQPDQVEAIVAHVAKWRTEPMIPLEPLTVSGDAEHGRGVYTLHCATCHGADGWTTDAPRLAGQTFQETYSDAMIRHLIVHGRPGTRMAAIQLGETELNDVIAYVRTLGKSSGDGAAPP